MTKEINRRDFIKKSAIGVGSSVIAAKASAIEITPSRKQGTHKYGFKGKYWTNWSNRIRVKPKTIATPKNANELRELVFKAGKVRAVGSSHSLSGIVPTNDTLVNTSLIKGIINIDEKNLEVTAYAGTKLLDFQEELALKGYCLPSTGDTFYQSLAGLLSTGTHGTGMEWGSCSDQSCLKGMTIILADGTLKSLHESRPEDCELLQAARVSLGALGLVYTVTLAVVPIHNLEHRGVKLTPDEALDPSKIYDHDHYEFAYFPYNNMCFAFQRDITDKPVLKKAFGRWIRESIVENTLGGVLLRTASLNPKMLPRITKFFYKQIPEDHDIDRADRVMTMPRKVPAYLLEYAIPLDKAKDAMEAFRELTLKFQRDAQNKEGKPFLVNLPAQVRFVRADEGNLIGPAFGRKTCWFGVGSHIVFKGSKEFFMAMEDKLVAMGGRPHWGKLFYRNPIKNTPNWDKFNEIRLKVDPEGKFSNKYIERLVGGESNNLFF